MIDPRMSSEPTSRLQKPVAERIDTAVHKALSHPLRYQILLALGEAEASPKELAEVLDEDFHRVCEHVKVLEKYGCIELVDLDTRRGGAQHIYRSVRRPFLDYQEWAQVPATMQAEHTVSILQIIFKSAAAAVASGDFDSHDRRALLEKPMIVDEQGFGEVDDSAVNHLENLERIAVESNARLVANGEEGIAIRTATIAHPAARSKPAGEEKP